MAAAYSIGVMSEIKILKHRRGRFLIIAGFAYFALVKKAGVDDAVLGARKWLDAIEGILRKEAA